MIIKWKFKIFKSIARHQNSGIIGQLHITRMTEVHFLYHPLPLSPTVLIFPEKKTDHPSNMENFSFPVGCLIARSMLVLIMLSAAGRRCVSLMSAKWRQSLLKQGVLAQLCCSQQKYAGSYQRGLWFTDWITFTKNIPSARLHLLLPNSEESSST